MEPPQTPRKQDKLERFQEAFNNIEEHKRFSILKRRNTTTLQEEIERMNRELDEREQELQLAAELGNTLIERNKEYEAKVEELERLVRELQAENTTLSDMQLTTSELQRTKRRLEAAQERVQEVEEQNVGLQKKIEVVRAQAQESEAARMKLAEQLYRQEEDMASKRARSDNELIGQLREANRNKVEEIENLKLELESMRQAHEEDMKKINKLATQRETFQTRLETSEQTIVGLEDELRETKTKLDAAQVAKHEGTAAVAAREKTVNQQLTKLLTEKANLESRTVDLERSNDRLRAQLSEQAHMISGMKHEIDQNLVTPRARPSSISIMDELKTAFASRMQTAGLSGQSAPSTPFTARGLAGGIPSTPTSTRHRKISGASTTDSRRFSLTKQTSEMDLYSSDGDDDATSAPDTTRPPSFANLRVQTETEQPEPTVITHYVEVELTPWQLAIIRFNFVLGVLTLFFVAIATAFTPLAFLWPLLTIPFVFYILFFMPVTSMDTGSQGEKSISLQSLVVSFLVFVAFDHPLAWLVLLICRILYGQYQVWTTTTGELVDWIASFFVDTRV